MAVAQRAFFVRRVSELNGFRACRAREDFDGDAVAVADLQRSGLGRARPRLHRRWKELRAAARRTLRGAWRLLAPRGPSRRSPGESLARPATRPPALRCRGEQCDRPAAAARSSVIVWPSRFVCSIITTASAPRGRAAPVMISTHWPGRTVASKCPPARSSPIHSRRAPGACASAARTAKPSRVERSKGG